MPGPPCRLPATRNASCENCHTISENGNITTGDVGYAAVADEAYHDVQCESCHGPGLDHVQEPDLPGNVPLARVALDDSTSSCAACHTGTHHPFVEEWSQSGHAQIVTSAASNPSCQSCHNGLGVLDAWGVRANFVEKGSTTPIATTCAVCHDPHGSPNTAQLRFPIDSPDPEQNLCMKCHIRRTEPAGGSAYGARPHAPQGAVLLGTAGYRPAGFAYDTSRIFTSHASLANPELCAGCHVQGFTVTDSATGAFVFQATGHLFRPIPCLDSQGVPTGDNSCAYTTAARTWQACAASGCHASQAVANSAFINERDRLRLLADQVWADLNADEKIDAFPTDTGFLASIMATAPAEFAVDSIITAAEGAEFNVRMVGEGRYANGDKSFGVHNPFLAEALLRANIQELQVTYPFLAPPAPAVQAIIDNPVGGLPANPPAVKPGRTATPLRTSLR